MNERTRAGLTLWISWLAASAVGLGAGWAAGWSIDTALAEWITGTVTRLVEDFAAQHLIQRTLNGAVIGTVIGAVQGSLQWLVLRHRLRRAGWWIAASCAGWAVGWPMAQSTGRMIAGELQLRIGWPTRSVEIIALVGTVAGLAVGIAHWLVLCRAVRRAGWWVAGNLIAGAFSWPVATQVSRSLSTAENFVLLGSAAGWAAGGATAAVLTGTLLLRLIGGTPAAWESGAPPLEQPASGSVL